MPTTLFPNGLDSIIDPGGRTPLAGGATDHAAQHSLVNDAILAIETKLGIDNSLDPGSITYQLNFSEKLANKGQPNGYPPLDSTGHIPESFFPEGGTVHSVTAADSTVIVGGTAFDPTLRVGTGIPESAITNLISDLASKATDSLVVHKAGVETITGTKTFTADALFASGRPHFGVVAAGADPLGVIDATTIVQGVINAAIAAGGVVYFEYGTFKCGNLTINNGQKLLVYGPGATINWTGQPGAGNAIGFQVTGTNNNDVTISNLTMKGDAVALAGVITTNGSSTIQATVGTPFTAQDVGKIITGMGIPSATYIGSYTDSTHVTLSSSATANVPVNANLTGTTTVYYGNYHAGVWVHSGFVLRNFKLLYNTITNVALGCSLVADASGSVDDVFYFGNTLDLIIGTTSGTGYGLHFGDSYAAERQMLDAVIANGSTAISSATFGLTAVDTGRLITGTGIPIGTWITYVDATHATLSQPATANINPATVTLASRGIGCRISHNNISRAQRHAIYYGLGAGGIVTKNQIHRHREGMPQQGSPLCAIIYDRTSDGVVEGNIIDNPNDGCIEIAPSARSSGQGGFASGLAFPSKSIAVTGNIITNPILDTHLIIIGSSTPTVDGYCVHVAVNNNICYSDGHNNPQLMIYAGKGVTVNHNFFVMLNVPGETGCIGLRGLGETIGRTFADGVIAGTTDLQSATAAFSPADVGRTVTGTGVPGGTTVSAYISATDVTLSQACTNGSALSITLGGGGSALYNNNIVIRDNYFFGTENGGALHGVFLYSGFVNSTASLTLLNNQSNTPHGLIDSFGLTTANPNIVIVGPADLSHLIRTASVPLAPWSQQSPLGIGTTTPAHMLHVRGPATSQTWGAFRIDNTDGGRWDIGEIAGAGTLTLRSVDGAGAPPVLMLNNAGWADFFGKLLVGAGSSAPVAPTFSFEARLQGTTTAYWHPGTNDFGGTQSPAQAVVATNTRTGGYDPIFMGFGATTTGTLKPMFAIGALATASWTDGNVGTQTSDLYIVTRNTVDTLTERVRIEGVNGRVGINTSAVPTPAARLHVRETASAEIARFDAPGNNGQIHFYDSTTDRGQIGMGNSGNIFSSTYWVGTATIGIRSEGALQLGVQSSAAITIREVGYSAGTGYVGFGGFTAPLSQVHLGGEASPELSIQSNTAVTGRRWGIASWTDGTWYLLDRTGGTNALSVKQASGASVFGMLNIEQSDQGISWGTNARFYWSSGSTRMNLRNQADSAWANFAAGQALFNVAGNTQFQVVDTSQHTGITACQVSIQSHSGGYGGGIQFLSVETGTSTSISQATIEVEGSGSWTSVATASSFLRISTVNAGTLAEAFRWDTNGNMVPVDGKNMIIGTGTGTKFGTSTSQLLSFWNATPIAQPANSVDLGVVLSNVGLRASGGNPPLNLGSGAFTAGSITIGSVFAVDTSGRVGVVSAVSTDALINATRATAHPGSATTLFGIYCRPQYASTTTVAAYNFYSRVETAAAAFTLVTAACYFAQVPNPGAASAITNLTGFLAGNQGNALVANAYGINVNAQSGATGINIGVRIDTATTAALWLGAETTSTTVAGGIAFGSGRDVTLFRSGSGALKLGGTLAITRGITSGALSTVTLTSGTGAQVDTASDRELHVPVTLNASAVNTATVVVALSPDNVTYSTLCTLTAPSNASAIAGQIADASVYVPAGWYVKMTATNATLGTGTYY